MKIEGLLPLGRLDPGVRAAAPLDMPLDLRAEPQRKASL